MTEIGDNDGFDPELDALLEAPEPLTRWRGRNKLDRTEATAFLVDRFRTTLEEVKAAWPDKTSCYVIPFTFLLEEEDDDPNFGYYGGLWVPTVHTQEIVAREGSYIHWRLDDDADFGLGEIGIYSGGPYFRCRLDYSSEVPVVKVNQYSLLLELPAMRQAVEENYGIEII